MNVSFVVIAYNEGKTIAEALKSIVNQATTVSWDLVVVDDGSTDDTSNVATQVLRGMTNVKVLTLSANVGRGLARQAGIDATSGNFIAFIDSDIVLPTNWLEICFMQIKDHAAVSGIAVPDGEAAVIARISGANIKFRQGTQQITGNNMLLNRSILDQVPFPTTKLGEDFRFAKRLERAGFHLLCLEQLHCLHSEKKSYLKSLKFMLESGRDANLLLAEFRQWRTPDSSAIATLVALLALLTLGFSSGFWQAVAPLMLVWFSLISLAFTATRFSFLANPKAWFLALLLSIPHTTAYLLGRILGPFAAAPKEPVVAKN